MNTTEGSVHGLYLHVEARGFTASVAQEADPALAGRPIAVVAGDGPGERVVSCSPEAQAAGVRPAMTVAMAMRACAAVAFVRLAFEGESAGGAFVQWLRTAAPAVELLACDEALLDLAAAGISDERDAFSAAEDLCRSAGAPAGVGLATGLGSSRLVARVATRFARPAGCFLIRRGHERGFLRPLPVARVPGIDPRTAEALAGCDIHRVKDLQDASPALLVAIFGRRGTWLHELAQGRDLRVVPAPAVQPRSVTREVRFDAPVSTHGALLAGATTLLGHAMREVIGRGLVAQSIRITIDDSAGRTAEKTVGLGTPTGHEANLVPVVDRILRRVAGGHGGAVKLIVALEDLATRGSSALQEGS